MKNTYVTNSFAGLVACVGIMLVSASPALAQGVPKLIHPDGAAMGPKHGRPGCLDWNTSQIFNSPDWDRGYQHYGANLHVYDNCIPDHNQIWYVDGKSIYVMVGDRKTGRPSSSGLTKFCMDFNRGTQINGKGHRVIGWDDCHGASIQQWTTHPNGAITVYWENQHYCLDWEENKKSWSNDVFAAKCDPASPSSSQKWTIVDHK